MENNRLTDDVHYATINVTLKQPPMVYVQTIVNPDYITKAPFLVQCKSALTDGAELVKAIAVGILTIWPLLLFSCVVASIVLITRRSKGRHYKAAYGSGPGIS
jgi:hypothetical protein